MPDDGTRAAMDRRRFLKLASTAGGGILLIGCAPAAAPPTPTAASKSLLATPTPPPKAAVSASIEFAATAGGQGMLMMPLLVAQELFLKEEGITQKWTAFAGGGDTVRAMTTGGQQIGHPALSAAIIAVGEGHPVRIIAESLPFSTMFWVVKPDSPIKSMKDLKGKKLGYSRPGSISQTYALIALRAVGLNPDADVSLVAAGGIPEQLAAVRGGVIDVAFSNDPIATQELLKNNIRIIASSNDFVTNWSDSMLGTTVDYAKTNGDVLRAYLRAHQKAMEFIKTNPEKAAEIWAKGQDVDVSVAKAAIKNYPIQKFTSRIDPVAVKAIVDDMLASKQIQAAPDLKTIIDQSFLPPELRSAI